MSGEKGLENGNFLNFRECSFGFSHNRFGFKDLRVVRVRYESEKIDKNVV